MKAIITGATGGLGRAFVFECAKRNYDLVLTATNITRLNALKEEVVKSFPNLTVETIECKLNEENSRKNLFEFLKQLEKKPNILINNAGYIFEGSVLGCSMDEISACIEVNVKGTTELTYWFLTNREKSVKNYCLFVSSLGGYYPMPQMATYASTKSYLTNLALALRHELKHENVNVSCICPGGMATSIAMKESLKSQGISGKLSAQPTEKVARIGIKNMLRNKPLCVPGFFNKLTIFFSLFVPKHVVASFVGKRWSKCEKKRDEYR